MTKRILVSNIAKVFDVFGWFALATVSMKIQPQRVWEEQVDWDDSVTKKIQKTWHQWRVELPSLAFKGTPHYYFPKDVTIASLQVHGFSDAPREKLKSHGNNIIIILC